MKEYRKARELAEVYVFGNKNQLTSEEIHIIKQSPFASVIEEHNQTPFLELVELQLKKINEQSLSTNDVNKSNVKSSDKENSYQKRINRYYSGVSREEIIELIRSIEDKFELEVPYNYSKIETSELKDFIKSYSERNIFDENTLKLVTKIVDDKEYPEEIMGALRVNIGR